jgi:NADH dehydrogenase
VESRLEAAGIELHLGAFHRGLARGRVRLEDRRRGRIDARPARGVLLCTGPASPRMQATGDGRLVLDGDILDNVLVAGDCASWAGEGFDATTAQAAVRKGRCAADTVGSLARGREPEVYDAKRLGFFLSLGPGEAVGWALSPTAVLSGAPAVAAREAIEARWALLLQGLDTFGAL